MGIVQEFSAYAAWRGRVADALVQLRRWVVEHELSDAQIEYRLEKLQERLQDDRLVVAFVAEFSRGKSELINAMFFADYGGRILPSRSGRTTMCPTELLYDAAKAPLIELLPIETRLTHGSATELKRYPEEWTAIPLDVSSADAMRQTLARVSDVKRVGVDHARDLGFHIETSKTIGMGLRPGIDGTVEIPAWRHAVINFPHPLLKQGLVILDTPGLNAIGAEPELTLNLLPNAHAILFILAADTGVTQSDLDIWERHMGPSHSGAHNRLVVLNKIDSLWDGLRTEAQIDEEITQQATACAQILDVSLDRVFPVSAQKGLVAKVGGNAALLERSQLGVLEDAFMQSVIPAKLDIVRDGVETEARDVVRRVRELLETRSSGLDEQTDELYQLQSRNKHIVEYIARKARTEKEEFDQSLQRFYAMRNVFTQLANNLFAHMGLETLKARTRKARQGMLEARFSIGLREEMSNYFVAIRDDLFKASTEMREIHTMMDAMFRKFSVEHGLRLASPQRMTLVKHLKAVDQLHEHFSKHFDTLGNLILNEKRVLTRKFFETVAVELRKIFEHANREAEAWLRAILAPLETQVRERQIQLRRRIENAKRINQSTETLEDRVKELQQAHDALRAQMDALNRLEGGLSAALKADCGDSGTQKAA